MTVPEIAKYLGKTERWVRREGPKYDLPLIRVGGSLRADFDDLKNWLVRQKL